MWLLEGTWNLSPTGIQKVWQKREIKTKYGKRQDNKLYKVNNIKLKRDNQQKERWPWLRRHWQKY